VELHRCDACGKATSKSLLERDFGGACPHCLGRWVADPDGDSLGRVVALKILAPQLSTSDAFKTRFIREARILASLNDPHIVQVFDHGREGDLHFLAMEHVRGTDLQAFFDQPTGLERTRLLGIVRDVARGLNSIHRAGLVHRDIKPSNLLVPAEGPAKIADFGLAIDSGEPGRLTDPGTFLGSPPYVSPEHIQGLPVDGRSDLYSLGVILYQGLAGRVPFRGPTASAVLYKHVHDAPPPLPSGIPPALEGLVLRLLAKKPDLRPASAEELERELTQVLGDANRWPALSEKVARVEGEIAPPSRWKRWAAAVAAVILLGAGGVALFRPDEKLFAHWTFDEGSGKTVLDRSGNGRNGTIDGPTWSDGALHFNGNRDRVVINAGEIPPPWTVSLWVKREASPYVTSRLMDATKHNPGSCSLRLEQSLDTKRVGITKYMVVDHAFEYSAPVGTWTHLAYVGTRKSVLLYADGKPVGTLDLLVPLSIGALGSTEDGSLVGLLDEVRVYERELSAKEIQRLSERR
jgi:serine/threonine protein kinase